MGSPGARASLCDGGGLVEAGDGRENQATRTLPKQLLARRPEKFPPDDPDEPHSCPKAVQQFSNTCSGRGDWAQLRRMLADVVPLSRQEWPKLANLQPNSTSSGRSGQVLGKFWTTYGYLCLNRPLQIAAIRSLSGVSSSKERRRARSRGAPTYASLPHGARPLSMLSVSLGGPCS